jgi:hypothetical protein
MTQHTKKRLPMSMPAQRLMSLPIILPPLHSPSEKPCAFFCPILSNLKKDCEILDSRVHLMKDLVALRLQGAASKERFLRFAHVQMATLLPRIEFNFQLRRLIHATLPHQRVTCFLFAHACAEHFVATCLWRSI